MWHVKGKVHTCGIPISLKRKDLNLGLVGVKGSDHRSLGMGTASEPPVCQGGGMGIAASVKGVQIRG